MSEAPERIPVVVRETYDDLALGLARRIADLIATRRAAGRSAVLGLATGSTPIGIYRELIRLHRDEGLDFSGVVTFNLDEYVPMAPDNLHSYTGGQQYHGFALGGSLLMVDALIARDKLDLKGWFPEMIDIMKIDGRLCASHA